jgi:hypothetical protein
MKDVGPGRPAVTKKRKSDGINPLPGKARRKEARGLMDFV